MDIAKLSDQELDNAQKLLFERQLKLMKGSWTIAILTGIGTIALFAGIIDLIAGGIHHGYAWLILPGAACVYMHYWEKSKAKENSDFLIKLGEEMKRREKTGSSP